MTDIPAEFTDIVRSWRPQTQVAEDRLSAHPAHVFAAMLDQRPPVRSPGDPLPPLWHWFHFSPAHSQSSLGEDGHPIDEAFVPPLADRRRMFGGGRVVVHRPLGCDELVERRSSVVDVRARAGSTGPLLLVTIEHRLSVAGELRTSEEQHIVYRRAADVAAPVAGGGRRTRGASVGGSGMQLSVLPDPRLLFRFSALTSNAHRIHYDHPYATQVEGYPGLVVQRPLLALLLLELPRRHDPRRVAEFAWRARRPTFCHEEVTVTAMQSGSELALEARGGAGAPRVTGIATMASR